PRCACSSETWRHPLPIDAVVRAGPERLDPRFFLQHREDDEMSPMPPAWRPLAALACSILLAACSSHTGMAVDAVAGTTVEPALIPAPASLVPAEGSFRFDAATRVRAEDDIALRVAG